MTAERTDPERSPIDVSLGHPIRLVRVDPRGPVQTPITWAQ